MKNILSLILLSSVFLSCRTQPAPQVQTAENGDTIYHPIDPEVPTERELWFSMERTPCFGACPWYKVEIFRDGFVIYEGKKWVEKEGTFQGFLNLRQMTDLKSAIEELQPNTLQDEYVNPYVADLPSTITIISQNGSEKKIINGYDNPPSQLVSFEKYIDHFIRDIPWKEIPSENSQD